MWQFCKRPLPLIVMTVIVITTVLIVTGSAHMKTLEFSWTGIKFEFYEPVASCTPIVALASKVLPEKIRCIPDRQ